MVAAVLIGDDVFVFAREARFIAQSVAALLDNGVAVARRPYVAPLPRGYIRTVPVGYRRIVYRGYNCLFVGGIYYRAVMYQGATVYVVVT